MKIFQAVYRLLYMLQDLVSEALRFVQLTTRSKTALAAEILFLRKQLAFFQEREIKPRRFDDAKTILAIGKIMEGKNDEAVPTGNSVLIEMIDLPASLSVLCRVPYVDPFLPRVFFSS